MKARLRSMAGFVLLSGGAGAAAGLVAGFIDGLDQPSLIERAAAAGFVALWAAPVALVLSLGLRLLARAWRIDELVESLRDGVTGGTPRLGAWLGYGLLSSAVLGAVVWRGMKVVIKAGNTELVYALGAPILAVGTALALVALSRPAVDLFAGGLQRLDRAVHRRWGRSPLGPAACAAMATAAALGLLALAWVLVITPEIGHFDLSYLPAITAGLAALLGVPWMWRAGAGRPRLRAAAAAIACALAVATIACSLWVRSHRPHTVLEIWGQTPLAGFAIDRMFETQMLRGELRDELVRPEARPGAEHPDIILITIDTLRADRTPPYGGKADMPGLVKLSRRAAVFEWAFSPGNVTRRSLPSIATGLSAPRLRGRVRGWALQLDPRHVLVAERLAAAGYDTAGFFCCLSQFGAQHRLGLIRGIDHVFIDKDSKKLATEAAAWLEQRDRAADGDGPLFMWLHFIEPHGWVKAHRPAPGKRQYAERYDKTLADVDRALVILADAIAERDPDLEHTLVALTSDHGEGLGEHGSKTHSLTLYNAEIRVPLILAGPGVPERRIERPVGLYDLAPTLMDLAGFVPPGMPEMDGVSLAPVLRGEAPGDLEAGEAYSVMIPDRSVPEGQRALVSGRYKIIARDGEVELYDIVSDPDEERDLADSEPQVRERLMRRLKERRRIDRASPFGRRSQELVSE